MNLKLSIIAILLCSFVIRSYSQASNIDTTFNTSDYGFGHALGASPSCIAVQTDGKIIIAGGFTNYNLSIVNGIARLNSDGTLDPSFNIGSGFNNSVSAIALQTDGKIVVAGSFTTYNGTSVSNLIRLNSNGSIDATYNTGTGAGGGVGIFDIAIQSDNKVVIVGAFTTFNGTPIKSVARINTNGTLDATFNPGTGPNNGPGCVTVLSTGKIMIGGSFTSYNGTSIIRIARLNSTGTLDTSFNPGTGPASGTSGNVNQIKAQTDGKLIVVGSFGFYNGSSQKNVARVNTNGTLDNTFSGSGTNGDVYSAAIQTDGKVLISGNFALYNGSAAPGFLRINSNGSADATFNGEGSSSQYIEVLSNDKILVGNPIHRLNADGSKDYSFNNVGTGAENTVNSIAIQNDGKIIIAGTFGSYNSSLVGRIVRLNPNGSIDPTFNTGTGANNVIETVKIQTDGKIIVCGSFTSFNGTTANRIIRLNIDGSIDSTFNTGSGADNTIYDFDFQSDGKIIIGGNFITYNSISVSRIVRLNSDGSFDGTFNIGSGFNNKINAIKVQSDDNILVGGAFTTFNSIATNRIIRLNSDGTLDSFFTIGTGVSSGAIEVIAIQNDGKILIGGSFNNYNGTTRINLARINFDGTLDSSFNPTVSSVYSLIIQYDGKIIIGGASSVSTNRLLRLNLNGTIDPVFNTGTCANNTIFSLASQSDSKILIGGSFTAYDIVGRNRIARLLNTSLSTGSISGSPFCAGANVSVPFTAAGLFNAGNVFTAQLSNSSGSFASPIDIGTLTSTTTGTINAIIPPNTTTGLGYRIRVISSDLASVGTDNGSDLSINALPSGSVSGQNNVNCYGGTNGSATVSASGGNGPYIYFWTPFGGFAPTANNLSAGIYNVVITDSRNCSTTIPVTISEPNELQISISNQNNVSCYNGSNGSANLSATGGSGGNTYLWTPGGYNSNSVSGLVAGSYVVQVSDLNGCSDNITVNISQPTLLSASTLNITNTSCASSSDGAATVSANGGTPPYYYNWQPSGGTSNTATNLSIGTYTVNISDFNNCTTTTLATIQNIPPQQEICVVTADSATGNYNIVIWEKPTNINNIDSFLIFREITLNTYQQIGAVHRDSLSLFNDYSANPNSTSYKYKIKVLDTCGTIGDEGLYHSSIHLQYFGSGNFLWTVYEIENTSNQVSDYNFYRDNLGNGNFTFLQLIPGGNNSYTDINYASYPNARYRVDVNWISGNICNPSRTTINTTRSNIKSAGLVTTVNDMLNTHITVYPNPANNYFTIQQPQFTKASTISIYNAIGELVYQTNTANLIETINTENLAAGVYSISIQTQFGTVFKKLIKQ